VIVFPRNSSAGEQFARDAAKLLLELDPPAEVKVVRLPGSLDQDFPEWIKGNNCCGVEVIQARLRKLVEDTRPVNRAHHVGGSMLVCMADVESRDVEWLWPGRIPKGRISIMVGRPGEGKSFVTTDMAARVSTGSPWPDGTSCPKGSVLLIVAEDDKSDTIKPRLEAHGADSKRIHVLQAVCRVTDESGTRELAFTLADVAALEDALKQLPDVELVIIDPIGSFLGGDTDTHRDNEVRSVLTPVAKLAEKYGPAVVVVAHRRKGGGIRRTTRIGGCCFPARTTWPARARAWRSASLVRAAMRGQLGTGSGDPER
jgi:hypothetical protein